MEILGLVNIPIWLLILLASVLLYYFYSTSNFGAFAEMGVKGPKPVPVFGNMHEIMKKGIIECEEGWVRQYGRVYGIHEGRNPVLIVGDLDMLRDITVKHFNCFTNRRDLGLRKSSVPPLTTMLTLLADDDWKHNRYTLSPVFSSGRLKRISGLVNKAANNLGVTLKTTADNKEPFDVKESISSYAMEVIASFFFGLDLNSSSNHSFVKHSRKFMEFSLFNPVILAAFVLPCVMPLLGWFKISTLPNDSVVFFRKLVKYALAERRKNPGQSMDFLQLMVTSQEQAETSVHSEDHPDTLIDQGHWVDKRKGQGLTDEEILAQSIVFFVAGHDTTSSSLTYALYQLALNPECQDKLVAEIDQHFPNNEEPGLDRLSEMTYLDQVISEALRINPPGARMDRLCDRTVEVGGLTIPAGMGVALPIYNIHHDPEYWPDPEKFDPERFTYENKKNHHPLQWIPFGYGPRNCIGMRLALMIMKLGLIRLLQKYRFVPNSKTGGFPPLFYLVLPHRDDLPKTPNNPFLHPVTFY